MRNKHQPSSFLSLGLLLLVSLSLTACIPASQPAAAIITGTIPSTVVPNINPTEGVSLVEPAAFPGAEGFGAVTAGGRGGKVIEVINLNDSGPGSLRAAINAEGPRIVVFRVAGTIELITGLVITNPFITIAGQTAPGEGITIRGVSSQIEALINVSTHDVVIRFLTLRAGPPSAGDAIEIFATDAHDTYNVMIDHNSVSWAVNRNLATWYDVHDISIQWNIFSEGLDCSIHPKGCHSKGVLLGGYASDENKDKPGAGNISFHHNLLAHNGERNPLVSTSGVTDVVNNVAYNPFGSFSHVDFQGQLEVIPVNYVGNYFKPGADTDPNKYGVDIASPKILGAKIFVQGNLGPHRHTLSQPETNVVDPDARPYVVAEPNPAAPVTSTSAMEAYQQVLASAGASMGLSCDGSFYSRRDAIDTRIVNDVKNGKGRIIDDPSEVGSWLPIAPATPCVDSDHDGMPDIWETSQGLNPQDPGDASLYTLEEGYTNIEKYLNGNSTPNK